VGTAVDAITGVPLIQEIDLELPFGSAVYRHMRTYSQYHELRHELNPPEDIYDHVVGPAKAGGEFWEVTGNGWMLGASPLFLIDAHYQVLAYDEDSDPISRRCVFIPDAHHAISFIQDTVSGEYVAPAHFGATLSHNGEWVDGAWQTRPTVFRVWMHDRSVCYTIRAIYEDVFPGFLPSEADRDCNMYSDHDSPLAYGDCANGVPYYGLVERIDDAYGNCIDIQYCPYGATNYGDPTGSCQPCTFNYNEKGQIARIRLVSGVTFDTSSEWDVGVWDVNDPASHPFDWVDDSGTTTDRVDWTLLFTYRSFKNACPYSHQACEVDQYHPYTRENAAHSVHVYQGEVEAAGPKCRTIEYTSYWGSHGYGFWGPSGDDAWDSGSAPNIDLVETLETTAFGLELELPSDWDYAIHYLYAEPFRKDISTETNDPPSDAAWYEAAYGFACENARGAPRLLKAAVTTRELDEFDNPEYFTSNRLYQYDVMNPDGGDEDQVWYALGDQLSTQLKHIFSDEDIESALEHLNTLNPSVEWTVNHLITGFGPDGTELALVEFPAKGVDGDPTAEIATWDQLATLTMYAWDGAFVTGDGTAQYSRSNMIGDWPVGDWWFFQSSAFVTDLTGGPNGEGTNYVQIQQPNALHMVPGVALSVERGIGGAEGYYRTYRFYISPHQYDAWSSGDRFVAWDHSLMPLRSVLHEPHRTAKYYGTEWISDNNETNIAPHNLAVEAWVTVIDEYKTFEAAAKGWMENERPAVRRVMKFNAAGFVLSERTFSFTDDGVLIESDGYTEGYAYDAYGRLTHIYSTGYGATETGKQTDHGLVTRFVYWDAAERDHVNIGKGPSGPVDIPQQVRAKGVQRGQNGIVHYSQITRRYGIDDAEPDNDRFDLVTEVLSFEPPTTDIDSDATDARTEYQYKLLTDLDSDGTNEKAADWIIVGQTTLGPPISADQTDDLYRPRETLIYDYEEGTNGQFRRGSLRWRIYGLEAEAGNTGNFAHTRYFDYFHYDEQGRLTRQVLDAGTAADGSQFSMGAISDLSQSYASGPGWEVDADAGTVPSYPKDLNGDDLTRVASLHNSQATNRLTKTWHGSSYGPVIIETSVGGGPPSQTQFSYKRRRGGMEVRTARFRQDNSLPCGPGVITITSEDAPTKMMQVAWNWVDQKRLYKQDYDIIAEVETQQDSGGRPTAATKTDWRGNALSVEARLDRFGSFSRKTEPEGTITRTEADPRGRPERSFIGTGDGDAFWGYDQGSYDNMILTDVNGYGAGTTDAGLLTTQRHFRDRPADQYARPLPTFAGQGWVQQTKYDWRMRPIWQTTYEEGTDTGTALRHTITLYDNLDRVRFVAEYGAVAPEPDPNAHNVIAFGGESYDALVSMPSAASILATSPRRLTETIYNAAGQVEEVREYDPESLAAAEYLTTKTWYDQKGRESSKIQPSTAATVTEYDPEGRVLTQRVAIDPGAAVPFEITRTEHGYDSEGRTISVHTLERTHDDPSSPTLTYRVNAVMTAQWTWYDVKGNVEATATVGAGPDDVFANTQGTFAERPDTGPKMSANGAITRGGVPDWAVLTVHRYDAAGRISRTATQLSEDGDGGDPTYRIDRSCYDGLGNLRYQVENDSGAPGDRRRTAYKYDGLTGQLTHIAAVLAGHEGRLIEYTGPTDASYDAASYIEPDWEAADGTLQVTRIDTQGPDTYTDPISGTLKGRGARVWTGETNAQGDPVWSHNKSWPARVYFPDPVTGQPSLVPSLEFTYYADGLVRTRTDARGCAFTHTYDQFGRRTRTDVTYPTHPLPSHEPFDLATHFEYEYDESDNLVRATACRNDGSGDLIISDNTFKYDRRGNLLAEQQSYGDAASPDPTQGDPKELIEYEWTYASATAPAGNYTRLDSMTYPAKLQTTQRREITLTYGEPGIDPCSAALSRISRIDDLLSDVGVRFSFAGTGRRVATLVENDPDGAPSTVWTQSVGDGGAAGYPSLDRFGRTADLHFRNGSGSTIHQYQYGYNSAGDRLHAQVTIQDAANAGQLLENKRSWVYSYDGLSRLRSAERGVLDLATFEDIDYSASYEPVRVSWGLDALGNWTEGAGSPDGLGGFLHSGRVEETRDWGGAYALDLAQTHQTDLRNQLDGVETDTGGGPTLAEYVHDRAGNLVADDAYWYQYDAFNRLVSVHEKGSLDFDTNGVPTTGDPGAWKLYMAYDALGRLISIQKPWTGGTDHRKAWLYYDGVRRIVEVFEDPVQTAPGTVVGGPGTAGGSGGYITYTDREYVWGPDYVDECLWQNTRPGDVLHVLQDASMDVVATLDSTGAVTRQWTYDPYGQPIVSEELLTSAHNRLGHHGLFFDRLDLPAPSVELVAAARGLYHNRNRTYEPRIGRFASSDPNETALSLVSQTIQGDAPTLDLSAFDAADMYGDGMSLYAYVGSRPGENWDPMGLYSDEDAYEDATDLLGMMDPLPSPGDFITGALQALVEDYSANLAFDVDWSMDWSLSDDDHSRTDNTWIWLALARGVYDAFNIGLPGSDSSVNPLDYVGKRTSGGGRAGRSRAKNGHTIHTKKGQGAHVRYREALAELGMTRPRWKFEHNIPGVGRLDAIDIKGKTVRELKPNTPSGRSRGVKQLVRYLHALEKHFGDPPGSWTGYLDFYDP